MTWMGTDARMREYGFTVTEHEPERPWIVLGSEHRMVTVDDHVDFSAWFLGTLAAATLGGRARARQLSLRWPQ